MFSFLSKYVHKKISENSPHSDRDSTESQNIARVPSSESNPLMINYLIENLNGGFNVFFALLLFPSNV